MNAFGCVAMYGTNAAGELVIVPAWDFPREEHVRTQHSHELMLFDGYRRSCARTSRDSFSGPARLGGNPPDLHVRRRGHRGEEVGVEVTQLTLPGRRTAMGSWKRLRRTLFDGPALANLQGWAVIVAGSEDRLPAFRPGDRDTKELIRTLRSVVAAAHLPVERAGKLDLNDAKTETGLSVWVAPMSQLLGYQPTAFYRRQGFELVASAGRSYTQRDLERELQRVVSQHDRATNDIVLLSVGSPDRDGYGYPGEALVYKVFFDTVQVAPVRLNAAKVVVHHWQDGTNREL
jgi:hypothetical protein